MFDINTIITNAINEAVNARITELLQQHANIVAELTQRIAVLEDAHDGDSLDRRIKEVEGRLDDLCNEVNDLENNLDSHVGDDDVHVEDGSSPDTDAIREAVQDILSEASLKIRF